MFFSKLFERNKQHITEKIWCKIYIEDFHSEVASKFHKYLTFNYFNI